MVGFLHRQASTVLSLNLRVCLSSLFWVLDMGTRSPEARGWDLFLYPLWQIDFVLEIRTRSWTSISRIWVTAGNHHKIRCRWLWRYGRVSQRGGSGGRAPHYRVRMNDRLQEAAMPMKTCTYCESMSDQQELRSTKVARVSPRTSPRMTTAAVTPRADLSLLNFGPR